MRGDRERGQSLVELTTGLMFLLTLLAGTVDAGRALFMRVALLDAAEEGALYGSYQPGNVSAIEDRIRDNSDGPLDFSDTEQIRITVAFAGSACAGHMMRVTVSYDFELSTPFIGTILGSQIIPITATSESLILSPECE